MPTYAYACADCGDQFDTVQSFSDAALTTCEKCGGKLRKQYGSIGVTFNGGGFYRTDSRQSSVKSESTAAKPSATSTSSTATNSAS